MSDDRAVDMSEEVELLRSAQEQWALLWETVIQRSLEEGGKPQSGSTDQSK